MTDLRQRYIEDMQLKGLSASTQEVYVSTVNRLAKYYGKSPEVISEEELRQYFLYLKNDKGAARSTCTVAICSIKLLYERTLKRSWPTLQQIRPAKEQKLPVVLSRAEVQQVLRGLSSVHHRVCLTTIYSCGLRTSEGVRLQVSDIDSSRQVLHLHQGKGNKERQVPLPEQTLKMLRSYWLSHHNRVWLFPRRVAVPDPAQAAQPMSTAGTRTAFGLALQASGIQKEATVRSLRHSYATHLLEAGVSLRLIQAYLGHTRLSTTARYIHLTEATEKPARVLINDLMADLSWSS